MHPREGNKAGEGLEGKSLSTLGLSSLEKMRMKGNLIANPQGGKVERDVLSSSPWDSGTGHVGKGQSCTRGGIDWTSGRTFWVKHSNSFLERWSVPQVCQNLDFRIHFKL